MTSMTFVSAVNAAIAEEMRRDDGVFCMATTPPATLVKEFGGERARQAPIAESAMTGMAVGAAGSGQRPVVLWSAVNFSYVAFDQVANQAARIHYMFGGQATFPIVFHARYLNGMRSAAQHSQTGYALFAHVAGLKLVVPSGAAEAKALMKAAIRDDNPVVFFEPGRLSDVAEEVPDDEEIIELGVASIPHPGDHVTLVAIGYMVPLALKVAAELEEQGISVEVINPRTLVPLDLPAIQRSVQKTGRLIVVDESFPTCSMASEIITSVVEDAQSMVALTTAPVRVTTLAAPIPFSAVLEDHVLPGEDRIREAVLTIVGQPALTPGA